MGEQIEQVVWLDFLVSNNKAKYKVIIVGLDLAIALTIAKIEIKSDSKLMVRQIHKEYEAKDEHMARYLALMAAWTKKLEEWKSNEYLKRKIGELML